MEPVDLSAAWQACIRGRAASPKLWMDSHLAAWAQTAGLAFVTFDAGIRSYRLADLRLLTRSFF